MGLKASTEVVKTIIKNVQRSPQDEAIARGVRKESINMIFDTVNDPLVTLKGVSNGRFVCLDEIFTFKPENQTLDDLASRYFSFTHRSVKDELRKTRDPKLAEWYKECILNIKRVLLPKHESVNKDTIKNFYKLISNRTSDEIAFLSKNDEEIVKVITEIFPSLKNNKINVAVGKKLKQVMNSAEYSKLSDRNKFTLKIATVLEPLDDNNVRSILNELNIPEEMKLNIMKMRFAHNPDSLAINFINDNERLMVGLFHKSHGVNVLDSEIIRANELARELDKTGIPLFGTPLPKGKNLAKIPTITDTDGLEYRVLDLNKIKGDMTEYGFPGITAEDFTIDATFVDSFHEVFLADVFAYNLDSYARKLCTTKIGLGQNGTHNSRKIGIPIEVDNKRRYMRALSHDLQNNEHGYGKISSVEALLAKGKDIAIQRTFIADEIKKVLNINDEQYAELFSQIADKRYFSQIKTLTLNGRKLSQNEINKVLSVIKESQRKLVNKGVTHIPALKADYSSLRWNHNETAIRSGIINKDFILYKAKDFSEVEQTIKDYARKNNKYIILINDNKHNC